MRNKKLTTDELARLSKKQLVEANTNMVKRLNSYGAFLFRLRWDETLFYSKDNAQPPVVISVAENKDMGTLNLNIGLQLDVGDVLYVTSKSKELLPGYVHTTSWQCVKYTLGTVGMVRESLGDRNPDLMKLVNLSTDNITAKVNEDFIFSLLGKDNLVSLPSRGNILSLMFHHGVERHLDTNTIWYKLDSCGYGKVCTLFDYKRDEVKGYSLKPEQVYVRWDGGRKGVTIYSDDEEKLLSLKNQLLETWNTEVGSSAYLYDRDESGNFFELIPRILF